MQPINKQKGLTGISIMAIVAVFAFVMIMLLKILPVYFDSFKVGDVISSLKEEPGLAAKSNREITTMILKRLDVNMVTDVTKNDIYIEKTKDDVFVDIEYEVRKHMFGNLDVVISFTKSVEAPTF